MRQLVFSLVLGAAFALSAEDLASYVDPFTGTSATGHTHPSAACPFGMVQAGPDTGCGDWAYCSGYQYRDTSVLGYSLTHLSGTGCADYNDVQILPFTGELRKLPMRSAIDKASETASPGYYRVVQSEDGIETEITATPRAALYRLTWLRGGAAKVLLNLNFGQNCPKTFKASATPEGKTRLSGSYWRRGWVSDRRIAYAFAFDRPWTDLKALPKAAADESPRFVASFDLKPGERLMVKVGLSMTGEEGAKKNLAAEIPGWDFDGARRAARAAWNALFARSTCEGTLDQRRNWYTALYHLYGQPNNYADVDGRYSAADNRLYTSADGTYYTTLSLWDTFRAAQPWYTLAAPEIVEPVIRSFLSHYKTYGRLPVMSYGGHNVDCMIGNHSVPVIADAYLKGFRGFDVALAFEAITNTLTVAHPGKPKENWDLWDRYGYFPCDIIRGESVSRGLECAYGDWCAAAFARATGHAEAAAFFLKRAGNWKNTFDPAIGFGRGKTSKGAWRAPFDPYAFGHGAENDNDFTEGNAFQYSWHVMQDVPGLVAAMGGHEKFLERLDALFTARPQGPDTKGDTVLLDISGMIGQYVHGNEPSHHVIYFYPLVGQPEKAAERIREVFDTQYHVGPDGLCGNDDCGQMSAWYVFSAMGFYPFNPCGGTYVLGAPQVPSATLLLPGGKALKMTARNLSVENKFVKSVTFNGKPLAGWTIRHADILGGGELVFEMSPSPVFTVTGEKPHTIDLGAKTTGGYAVFDVTAKSGTPLLTLEYACHPDGLTGKGDFQRETSARYLGERFDLPVLPGNVNRHEIYRIGRTGRFVAPLIQGQERYVRFRVEPEGASVTIADFAISNAQVFASEPLAGAFRCSDERLNKLWAASVWTCRLASFPNHDAWKAAGGRLMPRKLERGDAEGWCKTFASDDGTLEVTYEFDANPHFPVGSFDILTGIQRTTVTQDATNELKTITLPLKAGERFGFALAKESWPMIDSVVVRGRAGKVVYRDDFDAPPDNWQFSRTRAYMADGAKRDRLVWSGDLWWGERNVFHAFAPSVPYIRESILMLAENQTPEGYVQASPYPENKRPLKSLELGPWESDEFAAWLVPVAWDYLLYTGDEATLREIYPAIRRLMAYLKANCESDGLFHMRAGYSKSIQGDRLGMTDHTSYMNLLLWMCYRDAARIAKELREPEAAGWRADATALAATIRRRLWRADARHFKVSLENPGFRVLDNAFALAIEFATREEANAIVPRLARFGVGKIQALIERGKFAYGYGRLALRGFENSNWFKALEDAWPGAHCTTECMYMMTKTWWDESHPDTAMAGQISDYVLGVRPTSPGYRTWVFDPRPGDLAFAEGRVPTPRGVIAARWERVGERLKCRVKAPGEPERTFEIAVPKEPDLAEAEMIQSGVLEIYDCFTDLDVNPAAPAALEFDIGKVAGISAIRLRPMNRDGFGWPRNLVVEVADQPGRWTTVKTYADLPIAETAVDLRTVVGATRGRYVRLSTTKRGPAGLAGNHLMQFGKVTVEFE